MIYLLIIITVICIVLLAFVIYLLNKIIAQNEMSSDDLKLSNMDNLKELYQLKNDLNTNIYKNYASVVERLTKIDDAQQKIDKVSDNLLDFKRILTDKKIRGTFGEIQLNQILRNVFGDNKGLYSLQVKMNEGKIVDAALFVPEPIGIIPIDSKFPLENYNRIVKGDSEAYYPFLKDVKKHITDISEKYVKPQNLSQAIMFIPAEGVYSYIVNEGSELIEYAYNNKVWIASPTTLMSILTTIQLVIINIQRNKSAKILHEELTKLGVEFERYAKRWDSVVKDIDKLSKDIRDVSITSTKLSRTFEEIKNADIEKIDRE